MEIQPINSIECALLHNRFSPIAEPMLLKLIAQHAQSAGCVGECRISSSNSGTSTFNIDDYQVSVSQLETALPKDGFGGCLPQPITTLMMPDATHRVENHKAHTFVSISRLVPTTSSSLEIDAAHSNPLDFFTSDDALRAMKLLYLISDSLHRNNPASAIHWLPSDHLVSPHFFEAAATGASLTPLFVRPYLYSSHGVIGEGNPVGMVANGSQYMLTKPVIFEEATVDYKWMIQRTNQFIEKCLREDKVLKNGTNFSVDGTEIIEVIHKGPEPANPMGSYSLFARNVPKFNISGGLQSVLTSSTVAIDEVQKKTGALDENDPIDFAIIKALRDREQADEAAMRLPEVKDRRMGPRKTHEAAAFGRRAQVFGKR